MRIFPSFNLFAEIRKVQKLLPQIRHFLLNEDKYHTFQIGKCASLMVEKMAQGTVRSWMKSIKIDKICDVML